MATITKERIATVRGEDNDDLSQDEFEQLCDLAAANLNAQENIRAHQKFNGDISINSDDVLKKLSNPAGQ